VATVGVGWVAAVGVDWVAAVGVDCVAAVGVGGGLEVAGVPSVGVGEGSKVVVGGEGAAVEHDLFSPFK